MWGPKKHAGRAIVAVKDELIIRVGVAQHCAKGHFAACAAGRGHGKKRDRLLRILVEPIIIRARAAVGCNHGNALADVDGTATADGDYQIALFFHGQCGAIVHNLDGRIRQHLVKHVHVVFARFDVFQYVINNTGADNSPVGYQQNVFRAKQIGLDNNLLTNVFSHEHARSHCKLLKCHRRVS